MRVSSLIVLLGVYAAGLTRVWRRAGYGRGIRRFEAAAFGGGWLALVAALAPPLDELSETWLVAHMLQHELLMVVAAPLVALSAPMVATLWAVPAGLRRHALDAVRRRPIAQAWTIVTAPASVFLLHATPSNTKAFTCCSTSAFSGPPRCSGGGSPTAATAGSATAPRWSTCLRPPSTAACSGR
jgi:cytochrome c oxidase assembly factor CtaG